MHLLRTSARSRALAVFAACLSVTLVGCSVAGSDAFAAFVTRGRPVGPGDEISKHVVSLMNEKGVTYCMGVIVAKNVILTDAHCVELDHFFTDDAFVGFGPDAAKAFATRNDKVSMVRRVRKVSRHKRYYKNELNLKVLERHLETIRRFNDGIKKIVRKPGESSAAFRERHSKAYADLPLIEENDLGLVWLDADIPADFSPVRIATSNVTLNTKSDLNFVGFGWRAETPEARDALKAQGEPVNGILEGVDLKFLKKRAGTKSFVARTHDTRALICKSDSGGPAYLEDNGIPLLIGVLSHGARVAELPGCSWVYDFSDVRAQANWIKCNVPAAVPKGEKGPSEAVCRAERELVLSFPG